MRHFVGDYTGRRDDMFDGVVVDTGKVETVLAAAAARQGHSVLQRGVDEALEKIQHRPHSWLLYSWSF